LRATRDCGSVWRRLWLRAHERDPRQEQCEE
jgi:hypothetical protein